MILNLESRKKFIALFLLISIIITSLDPFLKFSSNTYAADQVGVVVNVTSNLNVRSGAGTSFSVVGQLKNGETVTVLGSAKASDNAVWYNISYVSSGTTIKGYVHSNYLTIISITPDADFEAYLTQQKFPDSYKVLLRQIHAQYPKWVFNAIHTNLDWNYVLDGESVLGRSLIPASSIASWKSFEKGAYDFNKNSWVILDGTSWVAASKEILAHYMDPRNSLNSTNIFQFENLSYSSLHKASGVNEILKNTFMSGSFKAPDTNVTYTYTDTFMKAAEVSGVSPYHLASRARQEQGNSGSALALGTVSGHTGYFNFFNIGAYNNSNGSALVNGAVYAKGTNAAYYLPWTNQYKSILGGAMILGANYITKGQNTLYLQKFNVVPGGSYSLFTHQYMSNIIAPTSESTTLKSAYTTDNLNSTAIVFNIPVFLNMPSSPEPKPTSTGDNNNLLKSLTVTGHSLTPSFDMYTQNYDLIVESNVSSAAISASASGSSAKISGTGSISLKEGNNTANIVVTAASGVTRSYKINIYRKPGSGGTTSPQPSSAPTATSPGQTTSTQTTVPTAQTSAPNTSAPAQTTTVTPVLKSSKYKIGTYITGVSENTSASAFISQFAVTNGSVKLTKPNGSAQTGTVGTGNILNVYNSSGNLYKSYTIVIYGDVTGNGKISTLSLLAIQKHILKISALTGPYLVAADVLKSNKISSLNLFKIQKHILRVDTIEQ